MVGYCIVCKWRSDYEPRRMFHRFPTDGNVCKAWLKIIGKVAVKRTACVCSLHFTKSCYSHKVNGQPYLKPDSIPKLYIKEQPSNLIPGRIRVPIHKDRSKIPHWKPPRKKQILVKRFACEICGSKFQTGSALKSHSRHVHKRVLPKNITVKPQDVVEKGARKMPETDSQGTEDPKLYKPSFECPLCEKKFAIYFTALQHIQKLHCVNEDGLNSSQLSLDIVKPVRIELCICNDQIRSDQPHHCPLKMEPQGDRYFCLGCEQTFESLRLFHVHLNGLHGEEAENYYFPILSEFDEWKSSLQTQTSTNYVKLNETTIYHCSHQPKTDSDNAVQLCPSTITLKEMPNGFHMTYYKRHVGHDCEEFTTPESQKKHCITKFFKDSEDIEDEDTEDEKDLYLQFKTIMKSIILDAAKINITTLNILLGKAFEITAVLNSYDEDDDSNVGNKKMSDEQIRRVLEDKSLKRKREPGQREIKRAKGNVKAEIENQNVSSRDEVKVKVERPVTPARTVHSPPSFNDSYKSFVDQTIMSTEGTKEKKKKDIVKTKIGQYKPNSPKADTPKTTSKVTPKSLTPKNKVSPKTKTTETRMPVISKVWTVKPDVEYEVKERDNGCNILILKI